MLQCPRLPRGSNPGPPALDSSALTIMLPRFRTSINADLRPLERQEIHEFFFLPAFCDVTWAQRRTTDQLILTTVHLKSMRTGCFHYFRKTGNLSHNFFMVKTFQKCIVWFAIKFPCCKTIFNFITVRIQNSSKGILIHLGENCVSTRLLFMHSKRKFQIGHLSLYHLRLHQKWYLIQSVQRALYYKNTIRNLHFFVRKRISEVWMPSTYICI